jgi:hypothetical protein
MRVNRRYSSSLFQDRLVGLDLEELIRELTVNLRRTQEFNQRVNLRAQGGLREPQAKAEK